MATPSFAAGSTEVIFFNVGQGDCTLLIFYGDTPGQGEHAVLIDCGSWTKPGVDLDVGATGPDDTVARIGDRLAVHLGKLRHKNVLDVLVMTHPDKDHYNMLPNILLNRDKKLRYEIRQVVYGGSLANYKVPGEGLGISMRDILGNWGKYSNSQAPALVPEPSPSQPRLLLQGGPGPNPARLYVIAANTAGPSSSAKRMKPSLRSGARLSRWRVPVERLIGLYGGAGKRGLTAESDANRVSVVLLLVGRDQNGARQRVFLMADAGHEVEDAIIGTLTAADPGLQRTGRTWLKMGHHGSRNSTTDDWMRHITPDGLLASAGTRAFSGTGMPSYTHLKSRLLLRKGFNFPPVTVTPKSTFRLPSVAYFGDDKGDLPRGIDQRYRTEASIAGLSTSMSLLPAPEDRETGIAKGVDWHLVIDANGPNTYWLSYE
ncbi:hypothetical protein [Kitasatospora sp. NPDC004531]